MNPQHFNIPHLCVCMSTPRYMLGMLKQHTYVVSYGTLVRHYQRYTCKLMKCVLYTHRGIDNITNFAQIWKVNFILFSLVQIAKFQISKCVLIIQYRNSESPQEIGGNPMFPIMTPSFAKIGMVGRNSFSLI